MREVSFAVSRTMKASPDRIWGILGDFGREHTWTTSVRACERDTEDVRVGTKRTCQLPRALMGRTSATETLVEFVPGHALAYVLEGEAGPFAEARSRWSLEQAEEGRARLTVEGRFVPKNWAARHLAWPLARPIVRRLTRRVMAELDARVTASA